MQTWGYIEVSKVETGFRLPAGFPPGAENSFSAS